MEVNKDIQGKIDSTLNAIEVVNVSPFFKDKTMNRLFKEKEVATIAKAWFSPKLQLATLVCFIILNVLAFTQINKLNYDENINQFAETYGFSTSTETSLLN